MKELLMLTAIFGIIFICGSVFYYYVVFLPEQESRSQKDIEAIRNVIAPPPPTQQELQVQREIQQKQEADFYKSMEEWNQCQRDILEKQQAEVDSKCKFDMTGGTTGYYEWLDCSTEVRAISKYQSDSCGPMY